MREITLEEINDVSGANALTALNALGSLLGNITTFSEFGYGMGIGLYDAFH